MAAGKQELFITSIILLIFAHEAYGFIATSKELKDNVLKFNMNDVLDTINAETSEKQQVNSRSKRDVSISSQCKNQEQTFLQNAAQTDGFLNKFSLANETKFTMALAWGTENEGKIIVACTEEVLMLAKKSDLYQSSDFGKSFININTRVNDAQVRSGNGLQKHPYETSKLYVVAHSPTSMHSDLYITRDGGDSFDEVKGLPFTLGGDLIFHPVNDPGKYKYVLANCSQNGELFLSKDHGRTWRSIRDHAIQFKWSTATDADMVDTIYITHSYQSKLHLLRSKDFGENWNVVHEDVQSFGMEGKFLYATIAVPGGDKRLLKVSTNEGSNWFEVQLPTLAQDRFYSILDGSEGLVFMHVDSPGDTGEGTLYTSDGSGIIFDESLQKHLYPNGYVDLTDFYKVKSIRGVYLASQMGISNSIHTVISFNRGATWQNISRPQGANCVDESKGCHLQIHNTYSIVKSVRAERPMSIENAPGIILVHAHIADALQVTPPDVYVSSDGGYSWSKSLDGPHHYQIADHGGLIVAVPADTRTPKVVKFSTDEGRCWHQYSFTDEEVLFTGLLTEPGNKAMSVSIWGFGYTDRQWRVFTVDFEKIIQKKCEAEDYETWVPHWDSNVNDIKLKGCLLGLKESFRKLKKDSWCRNGHSYEYNSNKVEDACVCTVDDYECDYGYMRKVGSTDCVKDEKFKTTEFDICFMGHEEEIISQGYRKVPGDKCKGGFTPAADKLVNLKETCVDGDKSTIMTEVKPDYIKDIDIGINQKRHSLAVSKAAWIVVTLTSLLLLVIATAFFIHRCNMLKKHSSSFRYSILAQGDGIDGDMENVLHNGTTLYDDEDADDFLAGLLSSTAELDGAAGSNNMKREEKNIIKPDARVHGYGSSTAPPPKLDAPPASRPAPKVKSYHDDSDVDLLED